MDAERWALVGDVVTVDPALPRARAVVVEGERGGLILGAVASLTVMKSRPH